jgi:hypothetical protein
MAATHPPIRKRDLRPLDSVGGGVIPRGAGTTRSDTDVPETLGGEGLGIRFEEVGFVPGGAQAPHRMRSPIRNAFPESRSFSETRLLHWTQ